MNRGLLIFLSIELFACLSGNAQITFTDSVRYRLKAFLIECDDASFPDAIDTLNLQINSLLTQEIINRPDVVGKNIDIYEFRQVVGTGLYSHALLVFYDKYFLINMRRDFSVLMKELLEYFDENPCVDKRLLPKFTILLSRLYMRNSLSDQKGNWFNFWEQRDSLSGQLDIKVNEWIQ